MKSKKEIFARMSATVAIVAVIALSAGVLVSPCASARGFGGAFGTGYADGFGNAYPWGFGSTGGGYYIEDSAERAYDASHYWDGSLRDSTEPSKSSSAQPGVMQNSVQSGTQPVSEAQRLQAADQTYRWGFDKCVSSGKRKP